MHFLLQDTYKV